MPSIAQHVCANKQFFVALLDEKKSRECANERSLAFINAHRARAFE
jgi:hypothetical protein